MERLLQVRVTAAGLVIVAIVGLGLANIVYGYPTLKETVLTVMEEDMPIEEKIATFESQVDQTFFGKNCFIETYGLAQLIMGKEEMKAFTIAKDEQDKLHYTYFQTDDIDVTNIGDSMISLAQVAEEAGAECFYMMPMSKIIEGSTTFARGMPVPDENQAIDDFLAYIQEAGVDALDLRKMIDDDTMPAQGLFYDTDHHWTTQTAFWAFTQAVDYMERNYALTLDPDDFYTDISNYNQITYEKSFMGSTGRTVGAIYGGIDDFTLIYPKFSNNFSHTARNGQEEKIANYGMSFKQALVTTRMFNQDTHVMELESDKYFAYLGGNYGYTHIVNHNMEDGAKVLFIKDSQSVPVAAFLATTCAEVDLIDPRWFDEDVTYYVANGGYDVVIVSVSPPNLIEDFFPF